MTNSDVSCHFRGIIDRVVISKDISGGSNDDFSLHELQFSLIEFFWKNFPRKCSIVFFRFDIAYSSRTQSILIDKLMQKMMIAQ